MNTAITSYAQNLAQAATTSEWSAVEKLVDRLEKARAYSVAKFFSAAMGQRS